MSILMDRAAAIRIGGRRWLKRYQPNESQHLFGLTLVVGVVCGLAAVAFHLSIRALEALFIDRALRTPGTSGVIWTVLSPTVGGLLGGAILTWVVPDARGSGIPQVKQAFATEGGRVRFRDAVGKFVVAALQIGSGASLGREGPTVHICAGVASSLARATALPPRSMRRLTPVGVAAGIAAAFNAPIAAVTFTIEEIVGTLDNTVLSGVVVAAALAAVIERGVLGVHPVIEVDQPYGLDHASSLIVYALLGIAAAVVSVAFTDGLLKLRLWFRSLRVVPQWAQPALGGLVTGLLAVLVLRGLGNTGVTGGGYETLGQALAGELGVRTLVVLCVVKLIATVFSYSSGGAGGIFAPALFMGAMLGGAFGYLDVALLDHEVQQHGAFALVGMGAVFAGVIRAPITSVLIIFEMTGGYGLVLPLMLANMTSYAIARKWRPTPIYEALLEQDDIFLPHTVVRAHPLDHLTAGDAMTADVVCLSSRRTVAEAIAELGSRSFAVAPVRDANGAVLGVVSLAELRDVAAPSRAAVTTLMKTAHTIGADEPLLRAVVRMDDLGVRQLLVVGERSETRLIGILAMSDVARAYARAAPPAKAAAPKMRQSSPASFIEHLMAKAVEVPGPTKLPELMAQIQRSGAECLIVRMADRYGVLLREHIDEFAHDEDLAKMLIAADLARPAPCVDAGADLRGLARAMTAGNANAVIVVDSDHGTPLGVVMRPTLGESLLEWFAEHGPAGAVRMARINDQPDGEPHKG